MKYLGLFLCIICVSCSSSGNIARTPDPLQAMTYYSLADGDIRDKNFDKAIENLQIALEYDPENVEIKEKLVEVYYLRAKQDKSWGKLLQDIKPYYKDTESVNIAKTAAYAMVESGKKEKAMKYLRDFTERNPSFESFLSLFAFTYENEKDVKIQYLDRALEFAWDNPEKIRIIYSFYSRIPNTNSTYLLEKCHEIHKDAFSRNTLVNVYMQKQQYLKIIGLFQPFLDNFESLEYIEKIAYLNALYKENMVPELRKTIYALKESGNTEINTALFEFSVLSGISNLVDTLATERLSDSQITENDRMKILSQTIDYFMDIANFDKAVHYLNQFDKLGEILSTIVLTMEEDKPNIYMLLAGFLSVYEDQLTKNFNKAQKQLFAVYKQSVIHEDRLNINDLKKIPLSTIVKQQMAVFFADIAIKLDNLDYAEKCLSSDSLYADKVLETLTFTCVNYKKNELLENYLRDKIESGNKTEEYYFALGQVLEYQGKSEEKEQVLKEAVKAFPENAELHNWLGYWMLSSTDRIDEAGKYVLKAHELDPDHYGILDSAVWYYHLAGDNKKALELIESGLIEHVESGIIAFHIAEVYKALDNNEKAKDFYNKALKLTNDEDAHRKAKDAIIKYNLL